MVARPRLLSTTALSAVVLFAATPLPRLAAQGELERHPRKADSRPSKPRPAHARLPKPLSDQVRATLDKARPVLLQHLRQQRAGVRLLVCLAALHDGIPTDDEVFAHALKRVSRLRLVGTYEAAIRLMLMAEHEGFPDRHELLFDDVKTILRNRAGRGQAFTYAKRNRWWDLSNTQYAALGLRAAAAMGHPIQAETWRNIAVAVLRAQHEDGGFGYSIRNRRKNPYPSMTVAGIAILQICKQHLPAAALQEDDLGRRMDKAIGRAWEYMDVNSHEIGSTQALSTLYFHYGLERAAVLSDVEKFGARQTDWYAKGARMLVDFQEEKSGAWRSTFEIRPGALPGPGSPVDTAFAVLFLRRKFQKKLPPTYHSVLTLGAQATESMVQLAANLAIRRGADAVPDILKAMRSPLEPRRRAAAIAIRELSRRRFGYDPRARPQDSAEALKKAELWWLKNRDRLRDRLK